MSMAKSIVDRWLMRLVLVLIACLLSSSIYLIWRVAAVVYRLEQQVVILGSDVQQVTATSAHIAAQMDRMVEGMEKIEAKTSQALHKDEFRALIDEAEQLGPDIFKGDPPDDVTVRQINRLLKAVAESGLQFKSNRRRYPAEKFSTLLYSKYWLYRKSIDSVDDFIDNVAARSMLGGPYMVIHGDDREQPVADWLREQLRRLSAQEPT